MAPSAPGSAKEQGHRVTAVPSSPTPQTMSHPEDVAGLSRALRSGAQPASPRDGDVQNVRSSPGRVTEPGAAVPRAITQPQGHHPAPRQPCARTSALNNRSGAAERPRAFLSWQPLCALDSWPSRRFVIFKASLLESAWLLPATGFEHFPTAPCTVKPANRK